MRLAEALAPGQHPGIDLRVGLVTVNRCEVTADFLCKSRPACIQPDKMRRKDDAGLITVQRLHGARQAQTALQQRGLAVPQPTPVQPGLCKNYKVLLHHLVAFLWAPGRETQGQIGLHHASARPGQPIQTPTQNPTQRAHHRQRQLPQQAHQQNADATERRVQHGAPSYAAKRSVMAPPWAACNGHNPTNIARGRCGSGFPSRH